VDVVVLDKSRVVLKLTAIIKSPRSPRNELKPPKQQMRQRKNLLTSASLRQYCYGVSGQNTGIATIMTPRITRVSRPPTLR
jgi:hypothetical protein